MYFCDIRFDNGQIELGTPLVSSTNVDKNNIKPAPPTDYVPSLGDRVLAHSTGMSDTSLVGTYTDDWYPGEIIKVMNVICLHRVLALTWLAFQLAMKHSTHVVTHFRSYGKSTMG